MPWHTHKQNEGWSVILLGFPEGWHFSYILVHIFQKQRTFPIFPNIVSKIDNVC